MGKIKISMYLYVAIYQPSSLLISDPPINIVLLLVDHASRSPIFPLPVTG